MAKKRWQDLSPQTRTGIVVASVIDAVLKAIALRDIWKRPADQIRGPKALWGVLVGLSNSVGIVPLIYLVFGRRANDEREPDELETSSMSESA